MFDVDQELARLRTITQKCLKSHNFERACAALYASGYILYSWNQQYTDDEMEMQLSQLAAMTAEKITVCKERKKDTVLFYDGFGADTRGLALNYLKALLDSGYQVIYLAPAKSQNRQPVLKQELADYIENRKMILHYYSENWSVMKKIRFFNQLVCDDQPGSVFFYSLPYDVAGILFMDLLKETRERFFINLTDHAFWLGKFCSDYYIDFRTYGTSISNNQRHIPQEKIRLLPYYPFINQSVKYTGLPFDLKNRKLIFSGGALYKTLGDKENRYYQIVDYILNTYSDTVFYYVGFGDASELVKLQKKYPDRVFYSPERSDFFYIYQDSFFYLNTFPMVGGLMMQYAAMSGVLPLTLRHNSDGDGILLNQKDLGIEFDDLQSFQAEIDRLMTDSDYKKAKEERLRTAVPSPEDFRRNLVNLLELRPTEYLPDFDEIDTSEFIKEYRQRFDAQTVITQAIVRVSNRSLMLDYPGRFLSAAAGRLTKRRAKK